jgi:hypothetical protein
VAVAESDRLQTKHSAGKGQTKRGDVEFVLIVTIEQMSKACSEFSIVSPRDSED